MRFEIFDHGGEETRVWFVVSHETNRLLGSISHLGRRDSIELSPRLLYLRMIELCLAISLALHPAYLGLSYLE